MEKEVVAVPIETQYDNLSLKAQATMHTKDAEMHLTAAISLFERAAEAEGNEECIHMAKVIGLCLHTIRLHVSDRLAPTHTEKNEADPTV